MRNDDSGRVGSSGQPNRSYRAYFLDHSNKIAKGHDIESGSDTEVRQLARLILAGQLDYPAIEVWDRTRIVCRLP
jgi:hypothetical protein